MELRRGHAVVVSEEGADKELVKRLCEPVIVVESGACDVVMVVESKAWVVVEGSGFGGEVG